MSNPILLVEDNPDDQLLTLRAFRKSNMANEVLVANDGEEAIDYFFRRGKFSDRPVEEIPELVLLDLKLPKVDGLEVLQKVRNNTRLNKMPIVILTSSDHETDIDHCYDLGANSYLRKPVDFTDFVTAVQAVGKYWLIMNVTGSNTVLNAVKQTNSITESVEP